MKGTILSAIDALRAVFAKMQTIASGKVPATVQTTILDFVKVRFGDDIRRNFGEARTPEGTPWPRLKYRSGMPLILTRALMRAAVESTRGATFDGKQIAYGMSGTPRYWAVHNFGWGRIPARRYYGPRATTLEELARRATEAVAIEIVHTNKQPA